MKTILKHIILNTSTNMKEEFKKEHDLQVWFTTQLKRKGIFHFAVPNGGSRHKIEAIRLNAEGVLAGVADLILVEKNIITFVELKILKGIQSPSQKEFQKNIEFLGFEYHLLKGRESCEKFLERFEQKNKIDANGLQVFESHEIKPVKFEDL